MRFKEIIKFKNTKNEITENKSSAVDKPDFTTLILPGRGLHLDPCDHETFEK